MAYLQGCYPLVGKEQLAAGVYSYTVSCPEIASQAKPGQFVHIRVDGFSLRRPISICGIDAENGLLRMAFEVRGRGTEALSLVGQGQKIDLLGPLGNGFTPPSGQPVILVGGGIGVPPLLELAARTGANATAILGFRTASAVILADAFRAHGCDLRIATDDGSEGYHGFVTGLLEERLAQGVPGMVCACGPMAMLKGVVGIAEAYGVPTQVSLEERMGCGVGSCLVCACKTVRDGREVFAHVCKDGPVFDGKEVVFE